ETEEGHREVPSDYLDLAKEAELARFLGNYDSVRLRKLFESLDLQLKGQPAGQSSGTTPMFKTPYQAFSNKGKGVAPPFQPRVPMGVNRFPSMSTIPYSILPQHSHGVLDSGAPAMPSGGAPLLPSMTKEELQSYVKEVISKSIVET